MRIEGFYNGFSSREPITGMEPGQGQEKWNAKRPEMTKKGLEEEFMKTSSDTPYRYFNPRFYFCFLQ
jgi:hypothetical protein